MKATRRAWPATRTSRACGSELEQLTKAWASLQTNATKIIDNQPLVLGAATSAKDFTDKLSALNSRMNEVVNILTEKNASASQVYISSRQMQLADRMGGRVTKILAGGADAQASADGFARDARLYGTVVTGLLNGAPELNIKSLDNPNAKQILGDISQQWAGWPIRSRRSRTRRPTCRPSRTPPTRASPTARACSCAPATSRS